MANSLSASVPAPHEHIVSTEFDGGEGVLVDLNTKRYYQLNETAMLVWKCLEKGCAFPAIVEEMTKNYEVDDAHAAASIEKVLADFNSNKLTKPLA
jgi:hypothetical protein